MHLRAKHSMKSFNFHNIRDTGDVPRQAQAQIKHCLQLWNKAGKMTYLFLNIFI